MVIEEPRPKKRPTIITYILIILCIVFFIITLGPDGVIINENSAITKAMWFIPEDFFAGKNLHTLITAAFLHGDWLHIISNMYFLWVFGDDAEDIMGRITFVIFYLFCAVIACVFYALITAAFTPLNMGVACVGASGAIFGVMAAYAIFLPNRTILVPGWGRVTAKYYIIIYIVLEIVYTLTAPLYPFDPVAHAAHVGGFLAGVLFAFAFKKLFQERYQVAKTQFLPAGHKSK